MRDSVDDDDLLRPALGEEDDAVEFDRPWRPVNLVLLTFFGGLPAGGTLLALNERKLGRTDHFARTLTLVIGASLAIYGILTYLTVAGFVEKGNVDTQRTSRIIIRAISVAVAGFLAWQQSKRFRLAQMHDVEMGRHLLPVILALVLGNAAVLGLIFFFTFLFVGMGFEV